MTITAQMSDEQNSVNHGSEEGHPSPLRLIEWPIHRAELLQSLGDRAASRQRPGLSGFTGRMGVSAATNFVELLLRLGFDKHRDHFGMLFTKQAFHLGDALLDLGYG
jgi:hypothetical protein